MLNTLRKGVKSWVAKTLLLLLIASFAVWGIGADMFSFSLNTPVVVAGDTKVSAERFADEMNRQRQLVSRQAGELVSFETLRAAGIDSQVLSALARDAAFRETLAEIGIEAPDAAVADAIRSNRAFQSADGQFSANAYQIVLGQEGFDPQEFERLTRSALGQQVLSDVAARGVVPPPGLAPRIAIFRGERRAVAALALDPDLVAQPAVPADDVIEAYFALSQQRFVEPERRTGRYLVVDPTARAAEITPTDEDLRAEYEVSIDQFTREATRTVDELTFTDITEAEAAKARIDAGEIGFEDLAAEMGVPETDYALGTVTSFDLAEAVADAAFAATEPGVVGPVGTLFGASILRITEVVEGGTIPFEEVRDRLVGMVAMMQARSEAPDLANRIDDLRADGNTLDEIAAATGLTLGRFENLARDGTGPTGGRATDITASPEFLEEVFDAIDLEERDIIETANEGYLVVMVDEIVESHLPALSEIRDRVIADWQRDQRLSALDSFADDLAARIADGATLEEIAAETGGTVTEPEPFQRGAPPQDVPPSLEGPIFAADTGGAVHGRTTDGSGVVLAVVTDVVPLPTDEMSARVDQIATLLERSIAVDQAEYFARAVVAEKAPSINDAAVDDVFRLFGAQANQAGY